MPQSCQSCQSCQSGQSGQGHNSIATPGSLQNICPSVMCTQLGAMSRRGSHGVTIYRKQLPLRGLQSLAPEFDLVVEGKEFTPHGLDKPIWRKAQDPCVTNQAFLRFMAGHLRPASIPDGILHGDPIIFQSPPMFDNGPAPANRAACLLFNSATAYGYTCHNRYRQILLGHGEGGKRIVIYAHRLICWIINGPITEEERKRRVTCHAISGCPPSGACCSPFHLRCEFHLSQNECICEIDHLRAKSRRS